MFEQLIDLAEEIVKTEVMGLIIEDCSRDFSQPATSSVVYYVSVPKDGDKVLEDDMPAMYGEELVKRFKQVFLNIQDCGVQKGHSFAVKYKIRDEYWTLQDARNMLDILKQQIGASKTEKGEYNSL